MHHLLWESHPLQCMLRYLHRQEVPIHRHCFYQGSYPCWYEKRHSNIPAHVSPCFRVKEGDHVIIGQCRPLSKTVRFNVLKVIPAGSSGGAKKAFIAM
ncbi:hypothetical protein Q3G72_029936 [Acer saccharum]|nr:hypothetical protein Q3G72_029936 [Acer saccharum]